MERSQKFDTAGQISRQVLNTEEDPDRLLSNILMEAIPSNLRAKTMDLVWRIDSLGSTNKRDDGLLEGLCKAVEEQYPSEILRYFSSVTKKLYVPERITKDTEFWANWKTQYPNGLEKADSDRMFARLTMLYITHIEDCEREIEEQNKKKNTEY